MCVCKRESVSVSVSVCERVSVWVCVCVCVHMHCTPPGTTNNLSCSSSPCRLGPPSQPSLDCSATLPDRRKADGTWSPGSGTHFQKSVPSTNIAKSQCPSNTVTIDYTKFKSHYTENFWEDIRNWKCAWQTPSRSAASAQRASAPNLQPRPMMYRCEDTF